MGGQVLGGGVIVFVAVALWLVYLLPSWQSRHRFTSAERNAVRLNQALRVLAETAEIPREVQLELTARTAHQQQKLARQIQAKKTKTELAAAKARLEVARLESARDRDLVREQRAAAVQVARAERAAAVELARAERAAAVEVARAERAAALEKTHAEKIAAVERAHAERAAVAVRPEARRAQARRRFRLALATSGIVGLAAIIAGVVPAVGAVAPVLIASGAVVVVASLVALRRLAVVASRGAKAPLEAVVVRTSSPELQDVALVPTPRPTWTPRELPRPLVASAGSRAAAVVDEQIAREALRAAAREEAAREIAAEQAPTPIESVRPVAAAAPSPYAAMGYVDDTEIEDHVRRLLERRASGQ